MPPSDLQKYFFEEYSIAWVIKPQGHAKQNGI